MAQNIMLGKVDIKLDDTVISCTTSNQQTLSQNIVTFMDPSSVPIHMGLHIIVAVLFATVDSIAYHGSLII